MKKKIKDLTFNEMKEICIKHIHCHNSTGDCPLCIKNHCMSWLKDLLKIYEENKDKEIDLL